MATAHEPRTRPSSATSRRRSGRFRWTADKVNKLADSGFFDDRRIALLNGILYEMASEPPHATAVGLATRVLMGTFRDIPSVRVRVPLNLGKWSLPVPDLALVAGRTRDDDKAHPKTALLIVEISDSRLRKDRVLNGHIYDLAGIADSWIVNLNDRQLEVYRNPGPDTERNGRFRCADVTIVPADGHIAPLAAAGANIAVSHLMP